MTTIESALPSEYNFQYVPDKTVITSLKVIEDELEPGVLVTVKGKIVTATQIETIGKNKLKLLKSGINDGTSVMMLLLWQNDIETVVSGSVYTIDKVRVKQEGSRTVISTTPSSTFSINKDDWDLDALDETATKKVLSDSNDDQTITVDNIKTVDVSRYKCCIHCNKKLQNILQCESKIVKCDRCLHRMRAENCHTAISVNLTVHVNNEEILLTIFHDVLKSILHDDVGEMSTEMISDKLLLFDKLEITYDMEHVISKVKELKHSTPATSVTE